MREVPLYGSRSWKHEPTQCLICCEYGWALHFWRVYDENLWENSEKQLEAHSHDSKRALYRATSEFFIDNLPVRVHFIIAMIRWTGLAP